ncbi:hypothetical protein NDN01_22555 [Sphingomonas sp. QA11]|uniref:hypothetical protein n=1 Tax=Sphingomonas sp. QA11 TaxID=2950605 RepID=UPI00234B0040|nr:hypothetical protein [Sphingomonas sp. QA11]WCM26746.1 hypothetical protein NDN01_22555 [Sphingomonas sp. QA11]
MMRAGYKFALAALLLSSSLATEAQPMPFDPATVDLAEVLACKIDGGHYVGFALSISDSDSPGSAKARGWVKLPTRSMFFSSYLLSKPLGVFGYTTSTVAFTGTAMFAVLDLPDPTALGAAQNIANILEGSGQFRGERLVDESINMDKESGFSFKNRSSLQIATNPAFPGKTLIGCNYDGELQLPAP